MHWWLQEAGVGLGGRMNEGVRRYKLQVGGGGAHAGPQLGFPYCVSERCGSQCGLFSGDENCSL